MKQILIDSNILVYAINVSSAKNHAAQCFLQEHLGQLAVAHQNITETLRVLTHPKFSNPMTTSEGMKALWAIADACHIISPNDTTIYITQELIKKHTLSSDTIFDAYLVATALSAGITTIASDNGKDFNQFDQMSVINPFI